MVEIGKRYGINLAQVPMVADTLRDLQAAQAAGCEPHLVRTGRVADHDAAQLQHLTDRCRAPSCMPIWARSPNTCR